jgi:hypothetical protein
MPHIHFSNKGFLGFNRPSGTGIGGIRFPSDESLGYYRSALRAEKEKICFYERYLDLV